MTVTPIFTTSSEVLLPNYSSHWNNKFHHWNYCEGQAMAPHGKQRANPVPREAPDGRWPWTKPSSLPSPDAPVLKSAHGQACLVQSLATQKASFRMIISFIRCIVLYYWILYLQTCVIFRNVFAKLGQSFGALCGHFIRLPVCQKEVFQPTDLVFPTPSL